MNKIDEYKKKINYDVWEDITNLPRKLFQEGIIQYHNTNSTNTVPRDRERTMIHATDVQR